MGYKYLMSPGTNTEPSRRGEKKLWIVTTLCVAGIFGTAFAWRAWNADPIVTAPAVAMPSPNAWDFYERAARAKLVTRAMADATAARPVGKLAGKPLSMSAKEALLRANAAALKTLRQGFAFECRQPPDDSMRLRSFAGLRELARLLVFEGVVKRERGDWAGAADSYIDAIRLGTDIPRGGSQIAMLVGTIAEEIGQRPLGAAVDKLDAPGARSAARRLEEIEARRAPYVETLRREKLIGQQQLVRIFREPGWRTSFSNDSGVRGWDRVRAATMSKRTIFDNYSRGMDAIIAEARKPYPQQATPPIPDDPYSKMALPVFARSGFIVAQAQASSRLLMSTLALRAHFVEHKKHPATLTELAPKYLQRVPDDPFAPSGPLRYKRVGLKYLLWSVGPDGADDGGRPAINTILGAGERSARRFYVDPKSRGDFVAGVNR